jgi:two-component system, chemotaxis family, CheB/CheR fusion protein
VLPNACSSRRSVLASVLPARRGKRDRVRRVATKFTPLGGEIFVRTRNEEGNGQLYTEVRDTGAGISPEALPRIFQAFEQAEALTTRRFGGLGLGLSIAKAVVEMHGSITAASDGRDKGATFTVRLVTVPPPQGTTAADHACGEAVPSAKSLVLLVEDHPDTARVMARLLEGSGHSVRTAHSAASALQLAAAGAFDVVVSDIGLPDATGYELMAQLVARHRMKGIALSGYGSEQDLQRSREAGFAEHLVKPVARARRSRCGSTRLPTRPSRRCRRVRRQSPTERWR